MADYIMMGNCEKTIQENVLEGDYTQILAHTFMSNLKPNVYYLSTGLNKCIIRYKHQLKGTELIRLILSR